MSGALERKLSSLYNWAQGENPTQPEEERQLTFARMMCLPRSTSCAEHSDLGALRRDTSIQGVGPGGGIWGGVVLGAGSIRRLSLLKDPALSLLPTPVLTAPRCSLTFSIRDPGGRHRFKALSREPVGSWRCPACLVAQTSLSGRERAHTAHPLHSTSSRCQSIVLGQLCT